MGNQPIYAPNLASQERSRKQKMDGAIAWLSDLSPRDKPWDRHRAEAARIADLYSESESERHQKYSVRMHNCAPDLTFHDIIDRETGEISLHLHEAFFCRCRFCAICQWRRTLRWLARIKEALPEIKKQYPTHRWLFLTLTVRNPSMDELKPTLKRMSEAFAYMMRFKKISSAKPLSELPEPKRKTPEAMEKWRAKRDARETAWKLKDEKRRRYYWPGVGAIKSLEVTKGRDGNPHPHYHCMILVPASYFSGDNYMSHELWLEMWRHAYGDSTITQVDIRRTRKGQTDESAIAECVKYSVKPSDLTTSPEWLFTITDSLHRVRAVEVYGALKPFLEEAAKAAMADDEDLIGVGDEESEELPTQTRFSWMYTHERYGRKRKKPVTVHDEAREFRRQTDHADEQFKKRAERAARKYDT